MISLGQLCGGDMEFSLYGVEGGEKVEGATTFNYMGKPLDQTDDD